MTNRILFEPFSENFSVKLIAHGDELSSTNIRYRYDNTGRFDSFKNYELGQVLTGGPLDQPSSWLGIQFEIKGQSKDSSNYFQFVTSGGFIDVQGFLDDPSYSKYAFYNLFAECKNIRKVDHLHFALIRQIVHNEPEMLNLEALGKFCYANMFKNCTSLINYPIIHADERLDLYDWCFAGMFNGCTSLTAAPVLPPTGLAPYCYDSMFYNCKSLSSVPSGMLPALYLAPYCYASMFNSCTSLTASPYINAFINSENHDGALKNMFMDCSNLHEISIRSVNQNSFAGNTTQNWVKGVPTRGTFIGWRGSIQSQHCSPSMVPYGWNRSFNQITVDDIPNTVFSSDDLDHTTLNIKSYVHYNGTESSLQYRIIGELPEGITFRNGIFTCDPSQIKETEQVSITLVVSTEDGDSYDVYKEITLGTVYTLTQPLIFKALRSSTKVRLRKFGSPQNIDIKYKKGSNSWTTYTIGTTISLSKNEIVAFSGNNQTVYNHPNTLSYYNFATTGLIDIKGNMMSLLNYSDTCIDYCFYRLFDGCSSIINPPLLPATTLANGCYAGMFNNCTSLTTVPELPATTLANSCYSDMFAGCTSLTSVPANLLPATELASHCYSEMFQWCSNLLDAPQLPATTLTATCYGWMFVNCTSLTSINVNFTDWASNDTYGWVSYVAPTGIFYKPSALPEEYGIDRIPSGWTVVNR